LCLTALGTVGLAVLTAARVTGGPWFYVLQWWWTVAALLALTFMWAILSLLGASLRRFVVAASAVVTVAVSLLTLAQLPVNVPYDDLSRTFGVLGPDTARSLDRDHRYLVRAVAGGRGPFANLPDFEAGLFLELEDRGYSVFADRTELGLLKYGPWRLAGPTEVDEIITVVPVRRLGKGYSPTISTRMIAQWDPLTDAERFLADTLEARIRTAVGDAATDDPLVLDDSETRARLQSAGASSADIEQLHALQAFGDAYAVFLAPARSPLAR
jgi:hypothetical protein